MSMRRMICTRTASREGRRLSLTKKNFQLSFSLLVYLIPNRFLFWEVVFGTGEVTGDRKLRSAGGSGK